MRPPPALLPLHHGGWRARLATAGLVLALLAVVGSAWQGHRSGREATASASAANVLAAHYRDARDALLHQEVLRHHALLEGVDGAVRTSSAALEGDVRAALEAVLLLETDDHRAHVLALADRHEAYAVAVHALLSGDANARAEERADAEVDALGAVLEQEAVEHDAAAELALQRVVDGQGTATATTALVSVLALVLLVGSTSVLGRQRRALERSALRLGRAALHDGLTGLGNRSLLGLRMDAALDARPAGGEVALVLVDLDRFKEINDTLGHHYGDRLLQLVGPRLSPLLRSQDVVVRLGGDEFAVLLPDVDDVATAVGIAERLHRALLEPFEVDGVDLSVEASVGVAVCGPQGSAVDLLQHADMAMYAAKHRSGGVRLFSADLDTHSPERLTLLSDLRLALQRRELVLHFQPKVALPSGTVLGLEALVRWQHPQRGLLMPADFLGLAEGTGLIEPLTRYVLDAALEQCARWRAAGHSALSVAVNVSARNLLDDGLVEQVGRLLAQHGVPAANLLLEVTESAVMTDPERAGDVLRRLDVLGVGVALDDFGAGYTSLAQLRHLPLRELKIDRQFITDLATRSDDEMIVRSIVDLGRNLGLTLVAEGIEDAATAELLSATGCETAQGYHFSRPIPGELLAGWLDGHPSAPAAPLAGVG